MTEPAGTVETCDRPSKRHQAYNPQYMESSVRSHADSLRDQPPVVTRPTGGHHRVRALDVASSLTPTEAQVLDCMIKAVKHADSKTIVRIAGGWVRDKLLGLQNEDIDVALDNCSGVAFAEVVNAYLESQGQSKSKVAKIEANPEQSKHLETARMKIMGIWVDLVNLRTEIYRSDSRIPDTLFGTAEEDALRRDFTLNALFYNVNEGKVEDMTGRGLEDLNVGIIRTPLPAMMTFRDDPLRVLRAVRFAARFGFTLHQDIYNAARDAETQAALRTKVSRERLGAELSGMLTGKMAQPGLALSMLQELCLCDAVYAPPDDLVPPAPEAGFDWASGAAVARAAARMLASSSLRSERPDRLAPSAAVIGMEAVSNRGLGEALPSSRTGSVNTTSSDSQFLDERQRREGKVAQTAEENNGKEKMNGKKENDPGGGSRRSGRPETLVRELFLCAALLPLAGVKHRVKKGRFEAAAQSVVLESLKLKRKEATSVGNILSLVPTFRSLANGCTTPPESSATMKNESKSDFSRLTVGLAIREAKELWPTCVDLCCAMEMYEGEDRTQLPPESCVHNRVENTERAVGHDADSHASVEKRAGLDDVDADVASKNDRLVTKKYTCLFNSVAGMGLERAWEMTPLIRGNELIAELQVPKGPLVGKLVAEQASWQLEHPEGTREQCVAFLKKALAQMR